MKYLGIYFTGTGNTIRVLNTAKEVLLSYGHTLDEIDTTKDDVVDLNEYDGLVVFYPVYAFNAPKPIIDYVKKIKRVDNLTLVSVKLHTGRSHQIRVQLSHNGNPLYGDQKYNKNAHVGEQLALFAYKLEFYHPVTKELMSFSLDMPNRNPFNKFKE